MLNMTITCVLQETNWSSANGLIPLSKMENSHLLSVYKIVCDKLDAIKLLKEKSIHYHGTLVNNNISYADWQKIIENEFLRREEKHGQEKLDLLKLQLEEARARKLANETPAMKYERACAEVDSLEKHLIECEALHKMTYCRKSDRCNQ